MVRCGTINTDIRDFTLYCKGFSNNKFTNLNPIKLYFVRKEVTQTAVGK